jgi:hypothetical protein
MVKKDKYKVYSNNIFSIMEIESSFLFLQEDGVSLSGYVAEDEASLESSAGGASWSCETVTIEKVTYSIIFFDFWLKTNFRKSIF